MNKSEFVEAVANKASVTKKEAEALIDAMLEIITSTLKSGGEVTLTGFGSFQARVRSARMGVNPQKPNEKIQIPEVTVPKFRAGKALKDALKK